MTLSIPSACSRQVIGLLGGSFDPPHAGHVHITLEALKRFDLNQIWWLVSPGNPLKPQPLTPINQRITQARRLMRHPKVTITDIETQLCTRYTADTLQALRQRYPHAQFVWLMGADNFAKFHLWQRWEQIMQIAPIGVLARPKEALRALFSPAARHYGHCRIAKHNARRLGRTQAPAWCYVNIPMRNISSTQLRASFEPVNDTRLPNLCL